MQRLTVGALVAFGTLLGSLLLIQFTANAVHSEAGWHQVEQSQAPLRR